MKTLAQVFAELSEDKQAELVMLHLGNVLLGFVNEIADVRKSAASLAGIAEIRQSELVSALPEEQRTHVTNLCNRAEALLALPTED